MTCFVSLSGTVNLISVSQLAACAGRTAFDAPSWGPNVEEFVKRFDARYTAGEGPKRLKNMYFTYLVEMRALIKVAPYLLQVHTRHRYLLLLLTAAQYCLLSLLPRGLSCDYKVDNLVVDDDRCENGCNAVPSQSMANQCFT